MKILKTTLAILTFVLVFALVVAGFLALQTLLVAGGALLAYAVAGWFGWFTGVGYGVYFMVGVCFWAFTIVVMLPTVGKHKFLNDLYVAHLRQKRADRRKRFEEYSKAFERMIETLFAEKK